jgi:hypothetical protein
MISISFALWALVAIIVAIFAFIELNLIRKNDPILLTKRLR